MKPLKVLVIDDEKLICWSFEKKLGAKGYLTYTAGSGEEGLDIFEEQYPDIVFLDNHLPGIQGLELIPRLKSINEDTNIIFMTAYESVDVAVEAMKRGASEYIRKPFSFDEIYVMINNISEKINFKNELFLLRRQQKEEFTFDNIIHESVVTKQIIQISKKIAKTDATTILLLGESGTGKDIFSRAIHNESNRRSRPFVTVNCSSLPDTLLESELFGHEKGAFTDAKALKKGFFEIAEGGTVFLDEIGEINHTTQVKLLGVLENRVIRRLGGTKDIPVNVRIIAATNKNLKESIERKTFREDLYYRLQVFQIEIPPLRERREDIPPLLNYYLSFFNKSFLKNVTAIDPYVEKILMQYNWPGNVRELRNVMERAVILEAGNTLQVSSLPAEIAGIYDKKISKSPNQLKGTSYLFDIPDEGISFEELEKEAIQKALVKAGYNQTLASKLLRISRDTLRYKKKKYKL
ncbi:Nitrogen regulation protein NR(I) [hydrothermal vent metagenome]|uniref:Nitrogen regulation protein NR(I) n=1 Tax=hydrothermal vent metagenome TaxID=652676 RepID=A0A3B0U3A0_9ZZZZ